MSTLASLMFQWGVHEKGNWETTFDWSLPQMTISEQLVSPISSCCIFPALLWSILTKCHAIYCHLGQHGCQCPCSNLSRISLEMIWGKYPSNFSSTGILAKKNMGCASLWRIQKHCVAWRLAILYWLWSSHFAWNMTIRSCLSIFLVPWRSTNRFTTV